jgi:hypothetical protein
MAELVVAAAGAAIGGWISGGILTAAGTLSLGAQLGWVGGSVIGGSYSPTIAEGEGQVQPQGTSDVAT